MNKIKWEQLADYKVPFYLTDQLVIASHDAKRHFFFVGKSTFFLFINHTLFVLLYELNEKRKGFALEAKLDCHYLSSIETLSDILQSEENRFQFLFCSSKGNLYIVAFSPLDFYSQMKGAIHLKDSSAKVVYYNTQCILIVIVSSLYLFKHDPLPNRPYNFTKSLIYQPNSKGERILCASIALHQKESMSLIIVFTTSAIKAFSQEGKELKAIHQYESEQSFIGKVNQRKVFYVKGCEEVGIYDVDTDKSSSIKFSSKKMFNKIVFNKVIEANEDALLIVNESKCELFTYSFKYNSFNRETTLFEHKDYFYLRQEQIVLALGVDYRQMTLKAKVGCFEWEKASCHKKIENDSEEKRDRFNEGELGEFERQYEELSLKEIKKRKAIRDYKTHIKALTKRINSRNYTEKKLEVISIITSIHSIDKSALTVYEHSVYLLLTIRFISLYGSHTLQLQWRVINLQFILNTIISRTEHMLQISQANFDRHTSLKLFFYLKQIRSLLI